ncbi:hypothetical protein GCM10010341_46520 [Streptomyces noursei]|nr:hypothetical protein GCM10010341_46520 [Streptomyces noursei]
MTATSHLWALDGTWEQSLAAVLAAADADADPKSTWPRTAMHASWHRAGPGLGPERDGIRMLLVCAERISPCVRPAAWSPGFRLAVPSERHRRDGHVSLRGPKDDGNGRVRCFPGPPSSLTHRATPSS